MHDLCHLLFTSHYVHITFLLIVLELEEHIIKDEMR